MIIIAKVGKSKEKNIVLKKQNSFINYLYREDMTPMKCKIEFVLYKSLDYLSLFWLSLFCKTQIIASHRKNIRDE